MKKFVTYTISLLALFATSALCAQTDSTANDDLIIDGSKVKIIIKEKKVIKQAKNGADSVVVNSKKVEVFKKDVEEAEEELKDLALPEVSDKEIVIDEEIEEEQPLVTTEFFTMKIGLNNLLNSENKLEMPAGSENMEISSAKSINFQYNFVEQAISLYKSTISLKYAIGIDFNNYRFENNIDLVKNSEPLVVVNSTNNYKKNKLVTQYLTVPVMLDLNIGGGDEKIKIAAGPTFGYLIASHQKQKWEDNGKHKTKIKDDYNLEKFRMGYEVNFGYGNIVLYGKYYPESIFKANEGPDLSVVSAGILIGNI